MENDTKTTAHNSVLTKKLSSRMGVAKSKARSKELMRTIRECLGDMIAADASTIYAGARFTAASPATIARAKQLGIENRNPETAIPFDVNKVISRGGCGVRLLMTIESRKDIEEWAELFAQSPEVSDESSIVGVANSLASWAKPSMQIANRMFAYGYLHYYQSVLRQNDPKFSADWIRLPVGALANFEKNDTFLSGARLCKRTLENISLKPTLKCA